MRIPPWDQFRAGELSPRVFPQSIIRGLTYRRKDNIESAVTDISDISVRKVLTTLVVYRTRCGCVEHSTRNLHRAAVSWTKRERKRERERASSEASSRYVRE